MLEALRLHLERSALIPGGSAVLVGYSGGPDSTCLLSLLHRLGIPVVAAHLHHGQRPEADEEAAKCQELCDSLGIPIVVGRADVPRMARDMKSGLEEAGRTARYGFFRQASRQTGCSLTATAHTQDDLVETMLLNLARGSGLAGLAGIPERRDDIIRPLLPFTRAQTQAFCREQGLWTHEDPANLDLSHARSRIRMMVVPELEAVHPGFRGPAARLARLVEEEDRFLNGMAAAALEKAETPLNGLLRFLTLDCEASFLRDELRALPLVLLRRSARLAVEALGGSLDYDQTAAAVAGILGGGSGSVTSVGGEVSVSWGGGAVEFARTEVTEPFRFALTVPGETESEEFGWILQARHARDLDPIRPRGSLEAVLDASSLKGSLHFRSAQPGDVLQPLGMEGRRRLSDVLSEMELTRPARRRLPVVCDMAGIVWVPGGPLADRVKVTSSTDRQLVLSLSQAS